MDVERDWGQEEDKTSESVVEEGEGRGRGKAISYEVKCCEVA